MTDNGARKREIAELARLLPAPRTRDFPAGRQQILKEHLMTQIGQPDVTNRRPEPNQRPKRSRGLVAVTVAGVAAVALAAFVIVNAPSHLARPAHNGPSAQGRTPATAAQLLAKIATAAASQPSPVVRNSEFMYIRSDVAWPVDTIVNGHETSTMEKLHKRQIWLPVANVCATGLLIESGSRTPLSVFPVVGNKVDRSMSSKNGPRLAFKCPSEGHLGDASYRLLQSMPTNPAALLRYLMAGKRWTNDDPQTEIGDLISESIIPPALAAALYRVAEHLSGATVVPDATNAVGRPGIGIAWTDPRQPQYRGMWIFDKKTLEYIGTRDYNVKTGTVTGESAILQRAFVAKAGQKP
jgi:hypothetical protein